MYTWILVAGALNSFIDACGIGSNDLANSFGTTYGSKVLSVFQIIILASIFEFSGALVLGSPVTNTLSGSISNVAFFKNQPYVLMYGMLCALAGSSTWLYTATYLGLPVSTTHSIVGGIMGFSLVYKGVDGVVWMKSIPDFPYVAGFVPIVISWVSSPVICAAISAGIYLTIRHTIIKSPFAIQRSIYSLPIVVFFTFFIEFLFILSKGAGSRITWDIGTTSWVSICIAAGASILSIGFIPSLQKKVAAYTAPAITDILEPTVKVEEGSTAIVTRLADEPNTLIHTNKSEDKNEHVDDIYDPRVEYSFAYLQIFTSICTSFAHGANDVSNAVGPLSAIWYIYQNDAVASKIEVPIWILALGGSGIVVGLATYGVKIMEVIGKKITYISATRGFSAELATALVVSFASKYGLPVSSTQCITGAVVGISLCDRNLKDINWKIMGKIFVSWIFTILITGAISAAIFSQGVYSPNM
jgi:solute carrier family 20 (sodium-dependent phosphate transporter)